MVLVGLIPLSFESPMNSTIDQQGNYQNPSLGIGFHIPEGWLVQEPKKIQPNAPDIAVVAPYSGAFTPSISFIVEKANGSSLEDFFESKKNQLLASQQNVTFLSEQNNTIDGYKTKIMIIREDFALQGEKIMIKFKQAFVLANDNFYTITYANEEKNFDSYQSNYDGLLNSITFGNTQNTFGIDSWFYVIGIGAAIAAGAILLKRKKKRSKVE